MVRATGPIRASRTAGGHYAGGRQGAVTTKVYIRGAADMRRALDRLDKATRDEELVAAAQAGVDVLAEEWRSRVPVEEGHYREAIEAKARPGRIGATGVAQVGNAPGVKRSQQPRRYAARLEFGSSGFSRSGSGAGRARAAQPSLRPAFDSSRDRMIDAMAGVLARLIGRAV